MNGWREVAFPFFRLLVFLSVLLRYCREERNGRRGAVFLLQSFLFLVNAEKIMGGGRLIFFSSFFVIGQKKFEYWHDVLWCHSVLFLS